MAEYIDKDFVLDFIDEYAYEKNLYLSELIRDIQGMPAENVVPVVRCKDCIYFKEFNFFDLKTHNCTLHKKHDGFEFYTEHDNYCSFGLKKDLEG